MNASLDADVAELAELLARAGAADVYVLPAAAARRLVEAREKAFWAAKHAGADDIVDAVVPRAAMADFLGEVARIATRHDRLVLGTGHAGDGNVHLALFEPDDAARGRMMREILAAAQASGGAVSGEHGIGTAKVSYFLELADPVAVSLMRRVKDVFDPAGILKSWSPVRLTPQRRC
jgi:glycolate oxidase